MLLIASLSVNFCWDWANHFNPTLRTSVTVRTMKRISWWHLKWPEKELTQSKPQSSDQWGPPKLSAKLHQFRKDGIPKSTQKQTDWSLSVWSQWSCYRSENLVEADECMHELKQEFTAMTEEALLFWLPKFVAEIRKSDGSVSNPLWTEQGSKISQPGGYRHV